MSLEAVIGLRSYSKLSVGIYDTMKDSAGVMVVRIQAPASLII